MFSVVAALILKAKQAWDWYQANKEKYGIEPDMLRSTYSHAMALKTAIEAGRVIIRDDDGTPLTPEAFAEKFAALETAQREAGLKAGQRQDRRHAADAKGSE